MGHTDCILETMILNKSIKMGGTVDFMLSVLSDLHSVYVEYIHILPKRLEEKRRNEEISKSEEFLVN